MYGKSSTESELNDSSPGRDSTISKDTSLLGVVYKLSVATGNGADMRLTPIFTHILSGQVSPGPKS